jgi:hypothetical protein
MLVHNLPLAGSRRSLLYLTKFKYCHNYTVYRLLEDSTNILNEGFDEDRLISPRNVLTIVFAMA